MSSAAQYAGLPHGWPAAPFPSHSACSLKRFTLPMSILAQLQSLISASFSHKLRLTLDLFGSSNSALFPLFGVLPHPARRWNILWHPHSDFALPCAVLARGEKSSGIFVGPSKACAPLASASSLEPHWSDFLTPFALWSVSILLDNAEPPLTAIYFDASGEKANRTIQCGWDPGLFPLCPIGWFDSLPFPGGFPPPFPLLQEHVLPLGPEPGPSVLPLKSSRGRSPKWLKPALPVSTVPFPDHDPTSPLFRALRALLRDRPLASAGVQDLYLSCMEFGFGRVSPSGCHTHRSEPDNSPKGKLIQDLLRSNYVALCSAVPPLAYGPFLDRPPFPRFAGGPQAIVSSLSSDRKGETWFDIDEHVDPAAKLHPDYPKSVGRGPHRVIQNASAPLLKASQPDRGTLWSLNDRVHFPGLRQVFACGRTVAELLSFFGPGTVVIQTDFPSAYKKCRLPGSSLFAHVSRTETVRNGVTVVEYWVDCAQIFGSKHAPMLWELFVIAFEHLLRHFDVCLYLTIHYVDNLFTFLPPWMLGSDPNLATSRATRALHGFFESLGQPHHDDHFGTSFPALGHHFHSLPHVAVGLKPVREPIVRALIDLMIEGSPLAPNLAIAARGMFSWLATIVPALSFATPFFLRLERQAKRALRAGKTRVDIPEGASNALSILTTASWLSSLPPPSRSFNLVDQLRGEVSAPPLLRASPAFAPSSRVGAVLRCDASPHFGCGGYSITARTYFHCGWDHAPHSVEADGISSTLAEAISAWLVFMAGARPGITVLQTDSDDLALLLVKGYSSACPLTNELLRLMHAHAISIGTSIHVVQILRRFNGASDRLAANDPFPFVVAPRIAAELGTTLLDVLNTFQLISLASASETLSLLRERTCT